MKRAAVLVLLAGTVLALPPAAPVWAKSDKPAASGGASSGGGLKLSGGKSGTPLEIYADDGMELSQDARKVIAHGNAKAIRGNVTVRSDSLIAYYRNRSEGPNAQQAAPQKKAAAKGDDQSGGGSEIWRVEAVDHVTIASPTQTVYGDHADYNIDDAVVVVTGQDLRLVTATDLVTAKDSLEYWDQKQQAVARGNAVAVRNDKSIKADLLTADFAKNEQGQTAISMAHGVGNVVLTTPREVVTGNKADYDVDSGIVTITGAVTLTRQDNKLNGEYAVVNLNTGVSKLYPTIPGSASNGQQRVKGFFTPQQKDGGGSSLTGRGQ